ncbi:MAG: ParB/RepB/Spo0J family partition protein [Oscillospiraceae bacterium]|nr:ParB/RepB/Spo0J family partition protein [Oscillospiraceae bacterium]
MADQVISIPLEKLHPFPNHPFEIRDDDAMRETVESVKQYGVICPAIVRPLENGDYEIIAGHRRHRACEIAGLDAMPVIVRELDDDAATILMVDSNLQREFILPSERAKAYQMKMEAIKRQAGRPAKGIRDQVGPNYFGRRSSEIIASEAGDSASQVKRFIRLTKLDPKLLQMVDDRKMGFTPAVEISYLKPEEQQMLLDTIDSEQATPSLSQAQRMKKLSQEGNLTDDAMLKIMMEQKKPDCWDVTLKGATLRKYFPRSYTPQQIRQAILNMLERAYQKRQQENAQTR